MKNLLLIVLFLFTVKSFSCECFEKDFDHAYADADIVLTAKILEVKREGNMAGYSKLNLEPISVYKGSFENQIRLYNEPGYMCVFYPPKETTWLLFVTKDKNGFMTIMYCSSSKQLDKEFNEETHKRIDEETRARTKKLYYWHFPLTLDFFQFLSDYNLNPVKNMKVHPMFLSFDFLDKYKDVEIEGSVFAYYELTVDATYNLVDIKPIVEFGNPKLKEEFLTDLKNNIVFPKQKTNLSETTKVSFILNQYKNPIDNTTRFRPLSGLH